MQSEPVAEDRLHASWRRHASAPDAEHTSDRRGLVLRASRPNCHGLVSKCRQTQVNVQGKRWEVGIEEPPQVADQLQLLGRVVERQLLDPSQAEAE
jgi:hypothetical protein